MNKRIKLLLAEARLFCYDDGTVSLFGEKYAGQAEIEKFAELIIQECASICELNGESYKHSFTPAKARLAESTSVYCGTLIKKHFGVE